MGGRKSGGWKRLVKRLALMRCGESKHQKPTLRAICRGFSLRFRWWGQWGFRNLQIHWPFERACGLFSGDQCPQRASPLLQFQGNPSSLSSSHCFLPCRQLQRTNKLSQKQYCYFLILSPPPITQTTPFLKSPLPLLMAPTFCSSTLHTNQVSEGPRRERL